VEGALRKQLRAADNHGDQTNRIDEAGDELAQGRLAKNGQSRSNVQPGESHCEPTGKSGESQGIPEAAQFRVGIVFDASKISRAVRRCVGSTVDCIPKTQTRVEEVKRVNIGAGLPS
jgi:hypothetical protein